jgi:hypothetical protein
VRGGGEELYIYMMMINFTYAIYMKLMRKGRHTAVPMRISASIDLSPELRQPLAAPGIKTMIWHRQTGGEKKSEMN